jgi:hypothetical protein
MCTKRNFGKGYAETAKFYPGVRYDPVNAMLLNEFLKSTARLSYETPGLRNSRKKLMLSKQN